MNAQYESVSITTSGTIPTVTKIGWNLVSGHWGAILAGAVAGLGTTILMGTLGAALGLSGTAAAIGASEPDDVAAGIGIGAIVWMLITAVVVGAVAGTVMNRLARHDGTYRPFLYATLNWAAGLTIALFLTSLGTSGLMAGVANAGGAAAGAAASRMDTNGAWIGRELGRVQATDASAQRGEDPAPLTPEERARAEQAADAAAKSAATLAWVALASMVVGLVATMIAARREIREEERTHTVSPAVGST